MPLRATLIAIVLVSVLPRVSAAQADLSDTADVARVHERRFGAMLAKDTVALATLASLDATFGLANGRAMLRGELFAALAGPIVFDSMPQEGRQNRVFGPAAVVTGRAGNYYHFPVRAGSERLVYTLTYERSNGTWRLVAHQSTLMAEPTPVP